MAELVLALSVMFVAAGAFALLGNYLDLSPIPFYIIAGFLVGPVLTQLEILDQQSLVELAQWGVAFLVFVFGLDVEFDDIRSVFRDAETAAIAQLLIVGAATLTIGYVVGIALAFEEPLRNAIYFSTAATLSSTLIGARSRNRQIPQPLVHSRLAASINFFDDIVAVVVLVVLSAATLTDPQLVTSNLGYGAVFLAAALLLYQYGFPLLVRFAGEVEELVLMGSVSILIGFLAAAEAAGVSIVVGAFAAGIAVRTTGQLGVQNGIESIRDFFVTIFFVTIGALVQVPSGETLGLAAVLVVLILFVNPVVYSITFLWEGYDLRTASLASSSLGQVSEMSLVIALQAWTLGTIAEDLFNAIILAGAVTMIATVFISRHEEWLYATLIQGRIGRQQTSQIDRHSAVDEDLRDHVIVVGYGRQGRLLIRKLEALSVPYVVIENDPVLREEIARECENYVFGDAMATYPVERAHPERAQLIVSTVAHEPLSRRLLNIDAAPDTLLRAESTQTANELLEAGATFVTVSNLLAAEQVITVVKQLLDPETDNQALSIDHQATLAEVHRHGFKTQLGNS